MRAGVRPSGPSKSFWSRHGQARHASWLEARGVQLSSDKRGLVAEAHGQRASKARRSLERIVAGSIS